MSEILGNWLWLFLSAGLYELTHDNMTEHPSTINVLERMNIYQEVILSILYRILPIKVSNKKCVCQFFSSGQIYIFVRNNINYHINYNLMQNYVHCI